MDHPFLRYPHGKLVHAGSEHLGHLMPLCGVRSGKNTPIEVPAQPVTCDCCVDALHKEAA